MYDIASNPVGQICIKTISNLKKQFVHNWTIRVDEVHISQRHPALMKQSDKLLHHNADLYQNQLNVISFFIS